MREQWTALHLVLILIHLGGTLLYYYVCSVAAYGLGEGLPLQPSGT